MTYPQILPDEAQWTLTEWDPPDEAQRSVRDAFARFSSEGARNVYRGPNSSEHLTVSSFVFSPNFAHVLLCHHRKGNFWVQLGGHIERGDATLQDAALREAREESGIRESRLRAAGVIDLDRHALSAGFGGCKVHWDVGFAFVSELLTPVSSEESHAVAWSPINDLPTNSAPKLAARIGRILRALGDR